MKKGKTKKLNFTTLARQTLASALSLSMIFSANVMTFAAGDAREAVATGSVVDFSKDGVVISTGNAATFNGTEVTFGTAAAAEEDVHGVNIDNPYIGNRELTSETLAKALQKTGGNLNTFVYRTTHNQFGSADIQNGPNTDRFYVAPYASVEEAVKAASDSAGGIEIVERLEDLTYATRTYEGQLTVTEGAITFDANNPSTYSASYASVTCMWTENGQNKQNVKNCYQVTYEGASIWINQDKRVLEEEPKASGDATVVNVKTAVQSQAMTNWDTNNYKNIKIMNLAQITGEGTSGTALNFIYPTWENGVSISAWVKASSADAAPIFTFMDKSLGYKNGQGYGGITLMTNGDFKYSPGSYNQGDNWYRNGRYEVTFGEGAVPSKNVGQWVLVTVNFKNNGAEVYYNGVQSKITKATTNNGSGSIKYFNHSYPIIDGSKFEDGLAKRIKEGIYTQKFLKYFVGESRIVLASKDKMVVAGLSELDYYGGLTNGYDSNDEKSVSIIEYITRDTTKLYIGGATHANNKNKGTACFQGWSGCQNDACVGMSIKDITFNDTLKTADEISAEFGEATAVKTVTDAAIETTDASALASYDFKLDENENAAGVKNLNDDVNGAAYSKDDKENIVVKLGGGVDGETPKGVELNNPFVKNANIKENIADALAKTGLTLDAWTYLYDSNTPADKADDYYRVADKSNKVEAGIEYASKQDSLHEEFNRNQVWAYAENTQATKAIVAKSTTSGDATVIVTEDAAQGVTMSVANVVLANAQAENNNNGGTYANLANLKKGYINQKTITTENIIKWSDGDIESVEECVEANKLGQTFDEKYPMYAESANPADTAEQYSYPYPTWTKGVTLGVWVKAATDAAANVFEFTDNTATLNFKADGTVIFKATANGNGAKNTYQAKFDGNTPASKVGEWVYVSLVIKNDNIDVYYNGVKAEKTMKKTQKEASYFNYGTGYAEADTAARITTAVKENGYMDVLKGFGNSTDYSDFTKYTMRNADSSAGVKDIMTFLTGVDTKLYLGGSSAQAPYSEANANMEIGTLNFYDVLSNDTMVANQFADAKSIRETGEKPINPTDKPVEPTDKPVEPTDKPVEPTDKPVEPTDKPVEPTDKPIEPTDKPVEPTGLAGDADCNNRVDLNDATIALRLAVGIETEISEQGKKNIDYNKDNSIDLNDATYTLKAAVGIAFTPPEKK